MKNDRRPGLAGWRRYAFPFLFLVVGVSPGCVATHSLVARDTAELALPSGTPVAWFSPLPKKDTDALARWRRSVGIPVIAQHPVANHPTNAVRIVSWNTAVGEADVVAFVRALPDSETPLVLLLQEVYRRGAAVPRELDAECAFASRLGGARPAVQDIEQIGHQLGLNVYYVPSMRNGGRASDEDRGNAILSSLPLSDLGAIELPFERQRRVAVSATLNGRTSSGTPWHVRVVSAHLDNMAGAGRAWVGAEYGRARQARGLVGVLQQDDEPTVLAGDFNTWFGFSDQAFIETERAFPSTRISDRRATFRGLLRLDHVFYRLAPPWRADFHRGSSRFGSDHYPLVGTLRFN